MRVDKFVQAVGRQRLLVLRWLLVKNCCPARPGSGGVGSSHCLSDAHVVGGSTTYYKYCLYESKLFDSASAYSTTVYCSTVQPVLQLLQLLLRESLNHTVLLHHCYYLLCKNTIVTTAYLSLGSNDTVIQSYSQLHITQNSSY